ncbi:hypothetical protein AHAS_Ahas07G0151800 [Arachis hypogaea]
MYCMVVVMILVLEQQHYREGDGCYEQGKEPVVELEYDKVVEKSVLVHIEKVMILVFLVEQLEWEGAACGGVGVTYGGIIGVWPAEGACGGVRVTYSGDGVFGGTIGVYGGLWPVEGACEGGG